MQEILDKNGDNTFHKNKKKCVVLFLNSYDRYSFFMLPI